MNGILAQTAALAAHAKARQLNPRFGGDDSYWRSHSTFKYVKSVSFVERGRGLFRRTEKQIATGPAGWLAALPPDGAIDLVSFRSSGRLRPQVASAFAGGDVEGIAVSRDRHDRVWVPDWRLTGHEDPEQRIWRVRYESARTSRPGHTTATIQRARDRVGRAVSAAARLAAAHPGLACWIAAFDAAEKNLTDSTPVAPYHPDILPPHAYSLAARQLLAASVAAFVFGGMGSWNDTWFDDASVRTQYEQVTRELYGAVIEGLLVAVNRGLPGAER